jgi:hypothetical protein
MAMTGIVLPNMLEPSLYLLAEHNTSALQTLRLYRRQGTVFHVGVAASVQIMAEEGLRSVTIDFTCPLQFTGILVVKDNIEPRPTTPASAAEAVAKFIRTDGLQEPRSEGWRYVLDPEG